MKNPAVADSLGVRVLRGGWEAEMLGRKERGQLELFITGSLRQLVPDDHILAQVDRVLDLSWLRDEVAEL